MDQKRTPKITFFLDQYEWKKINFPSEPKTKKMKFGNSNKTVALNVLLSPRIIEEIKQAYISKHNPECS